MFPTAQYGSDADGSTDTGSLDLLPPAASTPPVAAPTPAPTPVPSIDDTTPLAPQRTPSPYQSQPPRTAPPRKGKRGGGCLSTAVFFFVMAVIVGGVLLFLPPFSLIERLTGDNDYLTLDAANPALTDASGLTLSVDISAPGETFGVSLLSYDVETIRSGAAASDATLAYNTIPAILQMQDKLYTIETRGVAPSSITLDVPVAAGVDLAEIDLYAWDGTRWEFVPAHLRATGDALRAEVKTLPRALALFKAQAIPPLVSAVVEPDQVVKAEDTLVFNVIFPAGLQPTADGALVGELAPGFVLHAGYLVMPVVRNFSDPSVIDSRTVASMFQNDDIRAAHITQLRAFAAANGYDGLAIDYRGLPSDYIDIYSLFAEELARYLHADGRQLAVFLPAAVQDGPVWDTGAYDWAGLGRSADMIVIDMPNDPAAYTPGGMVDQMLRWAVTEVSRYKILIAPSALSVRQGSTGFIPTAYQEAVASVGTVELRSDAGDLDYFLPGTTIEAALDPAPSSSGTSPDTGVTYIEDGGVRVWLTTPRVLRARLDRALPLHLGGVCVFDLFDAGSMGDMVNTLSAFKAKVPPDAVPNPLAVRWTVRTAGGTVVSEAVAGLSTPFVWTADAEGDYRIVADLEGALSGMRGELMVPVAEPTATPTPTPEPTATPAPVYVAPANNSGGGGANPAPAPPSGSAGALEIGGHVAHFGSISYMQSAHMKWAKDQIRYHMGQDPGTAVGAISTAHNSGLKILLGIVGDPNELAAVGLDAYIANFSAFLSGVAALGPDAIEVWNEQNIENEWPNGQIDPAAYTRMLEAAYNAIKGVNGNVMVISGALAPTGYAAGGTSAGVWNDDVYYQGMANAGAANFMDCIGVHYNEGIVPPDWLSGDPRGGYPTYYLQSMTDRAWAPFGGSRPVCYTELGYLTSEGYGELPSWFAWAKDTTVAQQAAWLAGAAVINGQSGKVRLMIVWNVNFANYGTDPMAGYAIIRADGSCPACDALAQVVP